MGDVEEEKQISFNFRLNEETQIYFSERILPRNTDIID